MKGTEEGRNQGREGGGRGRTLPPTGAIDRPDPSCVLPLLLLVRNLRCERAHVEAVDLDERARLREVPAEEVEGGAGEKSGSEDGGPAKSMVSQWREE